MARLVVDFVAVPGARHRTPPRGHGHGQGVLDDAVFHGPPRTRRAARASRRPSLERGAWTGAAGVGGDDEKLTPDSVMAIASITKTFVAAEIIKLATAGKIDLDAPLSTYVALPVARNGATVRDALGMRTGIPDGADSVEADLHEAMVKTPNRRWTVDEVLEALPPRKGPPGRVSYADVNFLLLGAVLEKITGRTMAQLERADLFDPAGLRRIAAQDAERPMPPVAAAPHRPRSRPR